MKERKIGIRFGFLIAAAFFLFNPSQNVFDFLPDCLGYLLLYAGLSRIDTIVPHFERARRSFMHLFWLTLSRIPAFIMTGGMTHGNSDLGVLFTLVSFVYGVCELLCLYPAFREFYAGFEYLAERHGAFSVAGREMNVARIMTWLALGTKPLFAFLPELTFLSRQSSEISNFAIDYVRFRPILFLIFGLIGLVLGVLFLVFFIRHCAVAAEDPHLPDIYERLREENSLLLQKSGNQSAIKRALFFLSLGVLCCFELVFDRISYLPDALGALFFLCAALSLLSVCREPARVAVGASGLWACTSFLAWTTRNAFFGKYTYESLGRLKEADKLYADWTLYAALESVAAVFACVVFAYLFYKLIKRETGLADGTEHRLLGVPSLHAILGRKILVFSAIGIASAIFSFVEVFCARFTSARATDAPGTGVGIVVLPVLDWLWLIGLVLNVAWYLYARHLSEVITEENKRKYDLV